MFMSFPSSSKATTDETFTWDEVKKLQDKEFMRRAEYMARFIKALQKRYGDEVKDIAKQVIYDIGAEKGRARAEISKDASLESLVDLIAHKFSKLYFGTRIAEMDQNHAVLREDYCPLPVKWKDMGLSDGEIVELCDIFCSVDRGMVHGYNPKFDITITGCQGLKKDGYCQFTISKKSKRSE